MTEDELRNYCRFLFNQVELKDEQSEEILSQLSDIKDELHRTRIEDAAERKRLFDQVVDLKEELGSSHAENAQLRKDMSDLVKRLSVLTGEHYGSSKSQKGIAKRKPVRGKNDGRGDFDGTSPNVESVAGAPDVCATACDSADVVSNKGAIQLNKLVPALKQIALQDGADVNVDETWERYQTHYGHKKTYMWCLVNRKAGIVMFFCCLAHARAKFKIAYDQGCEKARFFLEKIGALYQFEEDYRRLELSANYLHSFWKQLFAYRNNGEYSIDNLAAERAIRPLTVQRKNSLFFGSTKGALNSAVYNTFIETCKQVGGSFREYFRAVLKELGSGRTDYENLLPMTIGIKRNN